MVDDIDAEAGPPRKTLSATEAKRLSREWRKRTDSRVALAFDHVKGPYNIGSILRTAASLRVATVYAAGLDVSFTDVKVQKTALGTHRFLDLVVLDTVAEVIDRAREDGFRVVGLDLAGDATPLWEVDMTGDVCLLVGNEDKGVSPKALQRSDAVAFVPMMGKVGSLNVATAASIAVYEARRQQLSR